MWGGGGGLKPVLRALNLALGLQSFDRFIRFGPNSNNFASIRLLKTSHNVENNVKVTQTLIIFLLNNNRFHVWKLGKTMLRNLAHQKLSAMQMMLL